MTKVVKEKLDVLGGSLELLRSKYAVKSIGIFGSFAKGRESEKSDIDIVVELLHPISFFRFIELERFLSSLMGRRVDLTTKKAIKSVIKTRVLKETLYA